MTELKFKLKKGGKCVGYERRKLTAKGNRMILEHRKPGGKWKALGIGSGAALNGWIDHDEICPFVCQDRNGVDVYEGDAILAFYPCGKLIATGKASSPRSGIYLMAEHKSGAVDPKRIELIDDTGAES